ncbi:MAG: glucose-6-phosphate dehydrogenase [Firmicutes bacterium]|nr:glucose-6-phosphate dehydrogenase [Bacillota bacterium]
MRSYKNACCIFVIFGGTGDLTHKKLIPAIYNLVKEDRLTENFAVVSIGRRIKTDEEYRKELLDSIRKYTDAEIHSSLWEALSKKIYYMSLNFNDVQGYQKLKHFLEDLDTRYDTKGNRVFYLATAPTYFDVVVDCIDANNMVDNRTSWQRIVIEKPFGSDLASAQYLNKKITRVFSEENIYRIDHYLGKEMIQNIMFIRFANGIFEPLWNNRCIDNIQITVFESIGIESRGAYYEKSGALRDMVQNHLFQMLALTAMEPPKSFSTTDVRDEKVKIIQSLKGFSEEDVHNHVVMGQYVSNEEKNRNILGYREENGVSETSDTETFVALKVLLQNARWEGVPFYLRTGKRVGKKTAYISVQFKNIPQTNTLYNQLIDPNLLVIRIQPWEGVFLKFNVKKPRSAEDIVSAKMDFCQNCHMEYKSPEAYERLLWDVMKGDSTLFTRWDEVEYSWRFIDQMTKCCKGDRQKILTNYEVGSLGPKEADDMLAKDHKKWWEV